LKYWLFARGKYESRDFPFIIAWGIWMAQNSSIFRDEVSSNFRVASNYLGFLDFYKKSGGEGLDNTHINREEVIDLARP
jgi:hypothetical protein